VEPAAYRLFTRQCFGAVDGLLGHADDDSENHGGDSYPCGGTMSAELRAGGTETRYNTRKRKHGILNLGHD